MDLTENTLQFKKLDSEAKLPTRGSESSAGLDLYASKQFLIPAHGFIGVSTGIAVAIPEGYYGRIAPRSGLAAKFGIDTLAGVIDSDYRGELICLLSNHGDKDFQINIGDRIAQLLIEKIITPTPLFIEGELPTTSRGEGGFGSTGNN